MIAYLKGNIVRIESNFLVVNVNGVGYKVFVQNAALSSARFNDIITLNIYTHVKEDQLTLFGFSALEDLKMFEMLLDVSGVGPKTALSILNFIPAGNIMLSIQKAKVDDFTKVPGIGKKVAQKIIVELQSKIGKISELNLNEKADNELVQALKNLGFTNKEAEQMCEGVDEDLPLEKKIKLSLKNAKK